MKFSQTVIIRSRKFKKYDKIFNNIKGSLVKNVGSRSFLLLELIIGLMLVTICILPFVRIPSAVEREEMLFIQRLEIQHLGERTCASVKERIYAKEISWEQICHPREKRCLLVDDVVSIPVKELAKQRYSRKCYLHSIGKMGQEHQESRLVTVRVVFQRIPDKLRFFSNKKHRKKIWYEYQFLVKQEKMKV